MDATKLFGFKQTRADGTIVEMVVWRLLQADAERPHGLKYRLYYGRPDERIVCYDNERGKGDHKHIQGVEMRYQFISVDQLIKDFESDVRNAGGEL